MKELTLEQMETTQGGKFWGTSGDCSSDGTWYITNDECYQISYCKHYVFWIHVRDVEVRHACQF